MDKDTALDLALGALEVGWSPTYTGLDAKEMGMKAITAIKQARSAPVQPVAWPAGLIDRIKAAEQRIQDGHAPRRIPADPTDVDLVLAEVRYLLEGKQPPFWIKTTPPAQPAPTVQEPVGDDEIAAWAERHDIQGSLTDLRSMFEDAASLTTPPAAQPAVPLTDDARRLDALAKNSWDLRCFDMSDDDIGWRVIEHHMAKPHERTVAEVFRDDPRQAIDAAMRAAHGITKGQP